MPYCQCRSNPDENMQELSQFLRNLCNRPAMYVGRASLERVQAFLYGMTFGYEFGAGRPRKASSFGRWLELSDFMSYWIRWKFGTDHPAWGFSRILLHFNNHDEIAAIRAIPDLFDEYLATPENVTLWKEDR